MSYSHPTDSRQTISPRVMTSRVMSRWAVGLLGSWCCVWALGPWVVSSILVRVTDSTLDAVTLREGDLIRWRSEGWATTKIGPHGLPGWNLNLSASSDQRVVIWGDSQVEGFCVNDADKICNQVIQLARGNRAIDLDCIPMGRSGSDARTWEALTPATDRLWNPRIHFWIVTELSDILSLSIPQNAMEPASRWQSPSPDIIVWAKRFHADAMFQATRNIVLNPATGAQRHLRWSLGPERRQPVAVEGGPLLVDSGVQATVDRLSNIHELLDGRLVIIYAPATPRLGRSVVTEHPDDEAWEQMALPAEERQLQVIDMRATFIRHWNSTGELSRGFHNGTPGYGHLNRVGNRLIAEAIIDYLGADAP
jgi:hypothetical protein